MKHILFIGYSNLLRKRILPILQNVGFDSISVAKHQSQQWDEENIPFTKYDCFEDGFNQYDADIVYISTINSTHYRLAKEALLKGKHVIVDKPSTLHFRETQELVNIAREKGLLICESTVYLNHPQFGAIQNMITERGFEPKHITVHFSFPPLNANNFRYKKSEGGGAIYDTGPYTASIGRYFFNETPLDVSINIHETYDDVDTSYSALLKYRNGKSVMSFCSFNTEYINRINILGNNFLIDLDRVFTIPDDYQNTIHLRTANKSFDILAPSGNTFQLFFEEVLDSIKSGNYNCFYNSMLIDSETIQMLNDKKKFFHQLKRF